MIFFNSSMPRSGSTLLQNILAQNPDIYATPTDGSLELLFGARVNFTNCAEFKAQNPEQMMRAWRGFCKGGLEGYVKGMSNKKHTCIKSRGIGIHHDWYSAFMGEEVKILCMVRNIKSILASMEKIFRQNTEKTQIIQNHSEMRGTTTEKRVQDWLTGPPVGLAFERFQQMQLEGIEEKCHFIKFEDLAQYPERTMKNVYAYLDIPGYEHNFEDVEQVTQEDDAVHNLIPTLHKIRKKVEYVQPDYKDILGTDLCKWIDEVCTGYQRKYNYI